ncbi:MAG TPA: diguanylate cyclase [Anaerolineales bacterium]|nr:diguanylate cyclase [Anaerolineales bacterium]
MLEYELFFRYSMDMYVIAGNNGYFKRANPAFCNMLGRSETEILSRPYVELIHPDDRSKVEGALKNLSAGHPAFLVEVRLLAADGTYRSLQWTAYPDPRTGLLFAIARDYSAPFFDPYRIKLMLDSSPTAVFLVEQTGTITYSNHLAESIFGYEKNQLIGKPIDNLLPLKYRPQHQEHRSHYLAHPVLRPMGILPNLIGIRKNGEEFPIDVGLNPVWLDRGIIVICSVIDTSRKDTYLREAQKKLAQANTRLSRLADRDALTGLYNRRASERSLFTALTAAREAGEAVSIILADIDHFKQYNDSFGHPAGDEFLKHLSEIMEHNIRREDTIARMGGEEFLIILPRINRDQAARFGERLRQVVEHDDTAAHPATISLGAATHNFTSKRTAIKRVMKQMISEADRAMYQSKHAGRNHLTHFADIPQKHKTQK